MADELAPIPYGRQWIGDDDVQAVVECLRGDWLTQGPTVEKFEAALCKATGASYAVAVSSGTAALHLLALACGVKPGDTGITTPITFVASSNAILYAGGAVRFADIDPATALIKPGNVEAIASALAREGKAPKVIVAVDMTGHVADLPAIQSIAAKVGAKVIEDAAHSLGATYTHAGQTYRAGCCRHSDAAILSFHPVKHITTAEGGAILTNDKAIFERVRDLRTHGIHRDPQRLQRRDEGPWYYEQDQLGYHYRITDLQCALGLSQLSKLESFVTRRRALAARYDNALQQQPLVGKLSVLESPAGQQPAYHLYVVRVAGASLEEIAARRKQLYMCLRERKIFTQIHYIPVTWQPYYQQHAGTSESDCPAANAYYAGCLSLPMYPKLSDGEQDRVIGALQDWARS